MTRRTVVTGLGPVTPIGIGRDAFWNAVVAGVDGSDEVRRFDTSMYKVHRACEVKDLVAPRLAGDPGPASILAAAATQLAIEDAGLDAPPGEAGLVIGTTGGEIPVLEAMHRTRHASGDDEGARRSFSKYPCHRIATTVANHFGLTGPNLVVPTACAAGNYAISIARDWIESGRVDLAFAGGADPLSIVSFTGFGRMFAMSPDRCRPFDRNRKGILPGEGAGILVLESLESARTRGARIYAEVIGYGLSCDAHHPTMPHPEGIGVQMAMERALRDAGLDPPDVDYLCAHGTGTQANDRIEASAIQTFFSEHTSELPVSSLKSMIGHTMGAASAIEAIACVLAIHTGIVPPTINYETPDPECALDVVPNRARNMRVDVALNNAYAFGGNNSSVVFSRVRA
jgi:3-oxoacyl-[acyl-carrier-protein] synthase II